MLREHPISHVASWIWPSSTIKIEAGQSVIIIGRPGTGKSTLLRWLLKYVGSVVIYDSKYDPEEWPTQEDYAIIERPSELVNHPRVVLRCQMEWLQNKEGWGTPDHPWGVALEHPMWRGDTIAAFDEAFLTWPVRGGHPGTHRLLQQGRSFRVTTIVGSQLANNVDTRLLRMANHIFIMGPCKHSTELECLFQANHVDTTPLTKLRKRQVAWWSEERAEWTVFRRINRRRFGRIRQRKVTSSNHPLLNQWGCVSVLGLIGLNWLALWLSASIKRPAYGIIFIVVLYSYIITRAWQSRNWRVIIESSDWNPNSVRQAPQVDINPKKRPPKSFRITNQ